MGILRKGIALWDGVWYNVDATQTNIFFLIMGEYSGNRCFLSLLIPMIRKRVCVATMRDAFFAVRRFHWDALFYCVPKKYIFYTRCNMGKRLLSVLMVCCMLTTIFPLSVFAVDTEADTVVTTTDGEEKSEYTVTFNADGKLTKVTVPAGETVAKPKNPKKGGLFNDFAGWTTSAEGGTAFDFDTPVTGDITLYAQWSGVDTTTASIWQGYVESLEDGKEAITYTVKFDLNYDGATDTPADQKIKSGECAVKPIDPTRSGYYFDGWYSDSKCIDVYNFSTPIKANICLYACWTTEGTDDAGDQADTEVTPDDIYILSADFNEVIAESNTLVKFHVNSTLTISHFELFMDGVSTGVYLYDDGDVSANSDDIPLDGCYSGSYAINIAEERDVMFTAKAVVGSTPIETEAYAIFVYYELSDSEIAEIETINETIQTIINNVRENNTFEEESKTLTLIHESILEYLINLQNDEIIDCIIEDKINNIITYKYTKNGINGGIRYSKWNNTSQDYAEGEVGNGVSSNSSSSTESVTPTNVVDIDYITYKEKALLLCYEQAVTGWNGGTFEDTTSNLHNLLDNAGFVSNAKYSVTVSDFINMQDYDYINISCHGSYLSVWTGPFTLEKTPVICTPERATKDSRKTYSADLKKHRIEEIGGEYYIRPTFFEHYYNDKPLKANIVSLGCCQGAFTDELVNSIIAAGASTVTAYSDIVYTAYDYFLSAKVLEEMCTGDSITVALDVAKEQYGVDDLVWGANQRDNGNQNFNTLKNERAVCNIYGNSSTTIHSTLRNGYFDDSFGLMSNNLIAWKTYGDARSIYKLSGLKAQSFPKMAIISSGFGSMNDETTSCIYQTVLVPEGVQTIEFMYDIISEEPMEYVGTMFNDIFTVDLLSTDGTILDNLAYESINTSTWYAVDGIDFPYGDDTTFHTRWKTISSNAIEKYTGQLVVIRFTVHDAGDSIYDTAAIIDSISIK